MSSRKATAARAGGRRVRDLASLISAVLRHPDTPAALYNDLVDHVSSHTVDVTSPDHVAGWLEQQQREAAAAKTARSTRKGER